MAAIQSTSKLARYKRTLRSFLPQGKTKLLGSAPPLAGGYIPYLGYGLRYGNQGPELFRELKKRWGNVFTLRMVGKHITFGLDKDFVKQLYSAPHEKISFFEGLKQFRGFGTIIRFEATGPEGKNVGLKVLREHLAPRVKEASKELDQEVRDALSRLSEKGQLNLRTDLSTAIVQLTSYLLVGPRLARDPEFLATMSEFDEATHGMATSLFSQRPLERAALVRNRVVKHLCDELDKKRQEDPPDTPDLLDCMLVARDSEDNPFTNEQIADELVGYLFGTTANTPAAAVMLMYHILQDPDLRRRVEEELQEVRQQCGDVLDFGALRKLKFLDACLNETLRLYTSGMHLRCLKQDTQMGPYLIPAGELVGTSPYVLHRDPSVYPNPDAFDPDRFLTSKPPSLHFVPFGRGLHACVGQRLAKAEIMLVVARVFTDLQPSLVPLEKPFKVNWKTAGLACSHESLTVQVTPSEEQ